jgi:hypothetical protein
VTYLGLGTPYNRQMAPAGASQSTSLDLATRLPIAAWQVHSHHRAAKSDASPTGNAGKASTRYDN